MQERPLDNSKSAGNRVLDVGVRENLTPRELVRKALRSLDKRLFQIVSFYYGLNGNTPLSFEEMGVEMGLPKELLVASEKKAIRKLRHPKTARLIAEATEQADQDIWHYLSSVENVVYKETLAQAITKLPGEYIIGMRCLYDTVSNWADHNAWQNKIAWFRSKFSKELVLKTSGRLKRLHNSVPLPITFKQAAQVLDIQEALVRQAVAISANRLSTYNGYIAPQPIGARKLRALRLHTIFREKKPDGVMTVQELLSQYLGKYADDDAIGRDVVLAMIDNSHLFIRLGHIGWYPILHEDEKTFAPDEIGPEELTADETATCFYKRPKDGTSSLEIVREVVRSKRVCKPIEIAEEVKSKTEVPLTNTQIPQILAQSFDFLQVSPSAYALEETLSGLDPSTADSDVLLTRSDIRWYAIARHAGEPMNTFPFWTPAMEWKWCQWAQKNDTNPARNRLYRSLLFVVDPHGWPVTDEEKAYWITIKQWNEHYFLKHDSKHPLWKIRPPLKDFLPLAICTCETGSMNWIKANRTIGNYTFDQHSIIHLSLLIGMGIVLQTDHWQKPHKIGPNAGIIKSQLMELVCQRKPISWNSAYGSELLKQLQHFSTKQDMGWISELEFSQLLNKLNGTSVEDDPIPLKEDSIKPDQSFERRPKQLKLFSNQPLSQ